MTKSLNLNPVLGVRCPIPSTRGSPPAHSAATGATLQTSRCRVAMATSQSGSGADLRCHTLATMVTLRTFTEAELAYFDSLPGSAADPYSFYGFPGGITAARARWAE